MPSPAHRDRPTARTVHIGSETWERLQQVAFHSQPRTSVGALIRDMIDRELPALERRVK